MTTIHYAINTPTLHYQPDTNEGRLRCEEGIEKAINTAVQICLAVGETTSRDAIITADRYLVDLHLTGECRGCEPISFGWTRDFEPPYDWVMRGFCKTSTARNPRKAHLLVAHVVEAWRRQGLVDWTEDEAGYLPDMRLASLMRGDEEMPPSLPVQTWLDSLSQALSQADTAAGDKGKHSAC